MARSGLRWIWISLLVIILDQASKVWMDSNLSFNQPVNLLPFFDLRLLYNEGAAWSILANAGGWQRWFLSGLSLVISIALVVWLSRLERKQIWLSIGLVLVLGGALGNLIDRVIYGYVIDFIDIYYQQWHWPAFNIADSSISLGAVMLVVDAILEGKKQ
ncbi:MAG: lipoprotein signal peptidase [Candidatus Marithrix sp.]|nr:lipoprotein signal peptidase [Candidatus Marithrix sp.]